MTAARLARTVAAATLVAAATVVIGPAAGPASAAPCSGASGVTVVVDPGALGGAVTTTCDTGSGQAAAGRYADSGVALSYVQRQPGFVCRVNDVPASDPCVNTPPTNAYWALWWTDGTSGTWTYASIGVTGLQVPDGGAVALAWQQDASRRTPAVAAPVAPSPSPTSTPKPTRTPTRQPTRTPIRQPPIIKPTPTPTPSSTPTPSPTASATPTPTPSPTPAPTRTPKPTREPASPEPSSTSDTPTAGDPTTTASSTPTSDDAEGARAEESGRVPTWVTVLVLVALLVAIGLSSWAARRRTRS